MDELQVVEQVGFLVNEAQLAQIGVLVVVIIALCEAVKYAGLNTRWVPLLAIVLGLAGSLYIGGVNWLTLLAGLMSAFTASGIFSGFKRTVLNQ
jgi:hypothetical protein